MDAAAATARGVKDPRLEIIAQNAVWWKPAAEVLANSDDFLCRVMAANSWDDITYIDSLFGEDALRHALNHAPAGLFAPATWHYWHYRLGYRQVPELPSRKFV